MKREEKIQIMKDKIINTAITLFGKQGYQLTSIDSISKLAGISKGIIYHYFKDKDELYLHCVQICFDEMTQYIKDNIKIYESPKESIEKFLELRHNFISNSKQYKSIFYETLFGKPVHLKSQLNAIRSGLEDINIQFCRQMISNNQMKTSISEEKIAYFFKILINAVWLMLEQKDISEINDNFIENEEKNVTQLLDIFFKGL